MTPPPKRAPRPSYASPQERSADHAAHQAKLKQEAAERRSEPPARKPRPTGSRG
jgi:hypothetical protein